MGLARTATDFELSRWENPINLSKSLATHLEVIAAGADPGIPENG
jgi:hypothetical protein